MPPTNHHDSLAEAHVPPAVSATAKLPPTNSLERLVPGHLELSDTTGQASLALHLERYRFASRQILPGRVLDMACGVGYGTHLLASAEGIISAVGVDIDDTSIRYARQQYQGPRLEFVTSDAMTYSDERPFDSVVSLETIEHVPDPAALVRHLVDLVRPGGRIIASVPVTPSVDVNPYHLTDFSAASFRALFRSLGMIELCQLEQIQPYSPLPLLTRTEQRAATLRPGLPAYYLKHPRALGRRILATLRFGFTNRYLTLVWMRPEEPETTLIRGQHRLGFV